MTVTRGVLDASLSTGDVSCLFCLLRVPGVSVPGGRHLSFSQTLGEHPISHAIMVPPARRLTVSLSLLLSCTVPSVGVTFSTYTGIEQADSGKAEANTDSAASGEKLTLLSFPSENPTELELQRWVEATQDRLRASRLLPYALSAAPTATPDFAARGLVSWPSVTSLQHESESLATVVGELSHRVKIA